MTETNNKTDCKHIGMWRTAGASGVTLGKLLFVVTTLYCKGCGAVRTASAEIPFPAVTQIATSIPKMIIKGKD